jgi:hypothetical protein
VLVLGSNKPNNDQKRGTKTKIKPSDTQTCNGSDRLAFNVKEKGQKQKKLKTKTHDSYLPFCLLLSNLLQVLKLT